MTNDERFERIEHVTAALVEEGRKDREEYRQLWRDMREELREQNRTTNEAITRLAVQVDRFANETGKKIAELVESDQRPSNRVDALVSAIGKFVAERR